MIRRISLTLVLCLCTLMSAHAQTAVEQTCSIKSSLMNQGVKAANEKIAQLFAWNNQVNLASFNASFGVLYSLKIVEIGVFKFGEMGDFYQRHLIIATAVNNAPFYLLLDYEKVAKTVRLFNVNFTTGAKEMLKDQKFFASPEPFSC